MSLVLVESTDWCWCVRRWWGVDDLARPERPVQSWIWAAPGDRAGHADAPLGTNFANVTRNARGRRPRNLRERDARLLINTGKPAMGVFDSGGSEFIRLTR